MAMFSKQAPLETFLRSVKGSSQIEESERSPDRDSPMSAYRLVILTILSQVDDALPEEQLMAQSELSPAAYAEAIAGLQQDGLVQANERGFSLTEAGRDAAERERRRLLSAW